MNTDDHLLDRFFRVWTDEFTRAVEMFTGVQPTVTFLSAAEIDDESFQDYLWWEQVFEGEGSFVTWVGTPERTWSALGGAMGGEEEDARQMYLEMLCQAQQGAATVLSGRLPKPISCADGSIETHTPPSGLEFWKIKIAFNENELVPVTFAIEPTAAEVIAGTSAAKSLVNQNQLALASHIDETPRSPMLERLLDVELPVSVALGRAMLPISDVLKLTSGSLIELDRELGEYVELLVHGTVVARGEVVSIKGNYGLRIKEIMSRRERMQLHGAPRQKAIHP